MDMVTRDSDYKTWIKVTDNEYTVEDVGRYQSVTIMVRECTSSCVQGYKDYCLTYPGKSFKDQICTMIH
jgi:hypothetical protein